jgi:hypothetical protein
MGSSCISRWIDPTKNCAPSDDRIEHTDPKVAFTCSILPVISSFLPMAYSWRFENFIDREDTLIESLTGARPDLIWTLFF